jgi:hypothetical protein
MSDHTTDDAGETEECLDALDDFVGTLQRFPDAVIALSLRMHLAGLLRAMMEAGAISRDEVHAFLIELEHETLAVGGE